VLILSIVITAAAITVPLILSARLERIRHSDFLADARRQDHVSERLKITNDQAASTAQTVNEKLDVIHVLVNSNMSAAMKSELDAVVRQLALMREVVELRRSAGQEPGDAALVAIRDTEAKVSELRAAISDREKASFVVAP
jgi:hypothetical protein